MKYLLSISALAGLLTISAQGQQLTPRDAFWSASDLLDITPNPAVQNKPSSQPATAGADVPAAALPAPKPPAKAPPRQIASGTKPHVVAAKGYGAEPHIVKLSQQPLGIRFALLKVADNGELSEVLPETVFHSGDKVKVSLMANQSGYVYIIQKGSSGNWKPLFPAQTDQPESNRVEAGRLYEVPPGKSFQFNQQTGSERLFILLSRQPVSDLDHVIFSLQQTPQNGARPGESQVEANDRISDQLVQTLKARDLTEVTDPPQETTSPALGEKAIYVVNQGKGNSATSQVFANLTLDHQ
jgi:hypothetical protein